MKEEMAKKELILFLLLGISAASTILVVHCQPRFVSIDCGYSGDSYNDSSTGILYEPDGAYIDTGENHIVTPVPPLLPIQVRTLRSFPSGSRNCYYIPGIVQGSKYLVRAIFFSTDSNDQSLLFDLYLGVNWWKTVNISFLNVLYISEIVTVAPADYFSVCLVRRDNGIPFISSLELRFIDSEFVFRDVNQSFSLVLSERYNLGSLTSTLTRYPVDSFDRTWSPCNNATCNIWNYISTTEVVQTHQDDPYEVSSLIMQTAGVALDNNTLYYPLDAKNVGTIRPTYYIYLHFAELEKLSSNESRVFQLRAPGASNGVNFSPDYLLSSHIPFIYEVASPEENTYFNLNRVSGSTLPPLLNAAEIYTSVVLTGMATDREDFDAMMSLKKMYHMAIWQGDPCAPTTWDRVLCVSSATRNPRITSLNLSHQALNGTIPSVLAKLTAIKYLDLSYNNFTGAIPPILADMSSLQVLNLSNNELNGSIPYGLYQRKEKGLLVLITDSNAGLCGACSESSAVGGKKINRIIIILSCTIAVVSLLLVLLATFLLRRRKVPTQQSLQSRTVNPSSEVGKGIELPPVHQTFSRQYSLTKGSPRFTYEELRTITNKFETVIGRGGFGTVYYGRLSDGTEVAVKVSTRPRSHVAINELIFREPDSNTKESKEFVSEVNVLARAHHRNLVSLIGYCRDSNCLGLVYEYMPLGSVKDRLSERSSSSKTLSWRERLQIAVESAQGLEYLHKACMPPVVHRDVKTSNILLSHDYEAKVADFGLSKAFVTDANTHVSTEVVGGTPGYIDPEYQNTFRLTEKSDVYSFGVVLLELITGLPALIRFPERGHIVHWVHRKHAENNVVQLVDPRLQGQYDTDVVIKVVDLALECTASVAHKRPTMSEVVIRLKVCLQVAGTHTNYMKP